MAYGSQRFNAAFTRVLEVLCEFLNKDSFTVRLLASCQTPKMEDHSWSSVHDGLFNIFTANLHIWRPTPPSATQGMHHAMVTGTHEWNNKVPSDKNISFNTIYKYMYIVIHSTDTVK